MGLMRATKLLMQGARPLRPQDVFATSLYTGTSRRQTINTSFPVDLSWVKARDRIYDHSLVDRIRGNGVSLLSNTTDSENINDAREFPSSGGFVLANAILSNQEGLAYVGWSFRQADKFFAIRLIQHTTGTASTISLPSFGPIGMVIGKNRSASGNWPVWHRSFFGGQRMRLNLTAAQTTTEAWISVSGGDITLSPDAPSGNYVLYVFARNPDLIDCGLYVGNGISIGPSVVCGAGWRPQFLIIKSRTGNFGWTMHDFPREDFLPRLMANTSAAEENGFGRIVRATDTGFQPTNSGNLINAAQAEYVYLAIRSPT